MRTAVLLLALWLLPAAVRAEEAFPDISGMAPAGDHRLLVVCDRKVSDPGPRLGLLEVGPKRVGIVPVTVDSWGGDLPNDLEACTAVPGREGEFLVAESGFWDGRFGRVFRLRLEGTRATVLGSFQPREAGGTPATDSPEQYEGLAAVLGEDGRVILVFGERGGPGKPSRLAWGVLEENSYQPLGEASFDLEGLVPGGRSCSDLALEPCEGGWRVLSVAALDPGDLGPFRSAVCHVGALLRRGDGRLLFAPREPCVLYRLEGLKVEALAPTPPAIPGSPWCIGTDDEVFGGVWRPLPATP